MKKRLFRSFVCAGIALIVMATPVLSAEPHEDPLKTEWEYSGEALFRYYSSALDKVINKNKDGVALWLEKIPYANVPSSITGATQIFTESMEKCTELLTVLEKELYELQVLIQQSRIVEANPLANQILDDLVTGYRAVEQGENAIHIMGKTFRVDVEEANSPTRLAYEEVIRKMASIRAMFNLYRDLQINVITGYVTSDVVNAILSVDNTSTTNTIGINIELTATIEKARLETELSLIVNPVDVFVGESVRASGTLTSEGQLLANRKIEIILNSFTVVTSMTDESGNYETFFQVPYEYSKSMIVQALYYPRDEDVDIYLACLSPQITLNVNFYEILISLDAKDKGYPGREIIVKVNWEYEPDAPAIERNFELLIDNVITARLIAAEGFSQNIELPSNLKLGLHRLTVVCFAQGRYAADEAIKFIDIVKVAACLDLKIPHVIVIPRTYEIKGSVSSELGPLNNALVRVQHASDVLEFYCNSEGYFLEKLTLHYNFALIGSESWMIRVVPSEPWNGSTSYSYKVLVVNGINCGVFFGLLIAVGIILPMKLKIRIEIPKWRRERRSPEVAIAGPQQKAPAPIYEESFVKSGTDEVEKKAVIEPRIKILSGYASLIRLIQRVCGVILKPHQTLREFVNETAKLLGPIKNYLIEFTRMIERLLYSREPANDNDEERSAQLAQQIKEGLKNENP